MSRYEKKKKKVKDNDPDYFLSQSDATCSKSSRQKENDPNSSNMVSYG